MHYMLVGNDIVDIQEPDALGRADQPRYLRRVLTERERAWLAERGAQDLQVAKLWAAKEAAFKVLAKHPEHRCCRRFLPRRFEVDPEQLVVRHGELEVPFRWSQSSAFVHCWAALGVDPDSVVRVVALREALDESLEVRRLARKAAARLLGARVSEVAIAQGVQRRPLLLSRRGPLDVSLSHHGRFLACALPLGAVPARPTRSASPVERGGAPV